MPVLENTIVAAVVVTISSIILLLSRDWRVSVVVLAAQYVGVFFLVGSSWPRLVAVITLISGWVSSLVLTMAVASLPEFISRENIRAMPGHREARRWVFPFLQLLVERAFYLLAAFLILFAIGSQVPNLLAIIPGLTPQHAWSGLVLIGLGLLITGFLESPLQVAIGLLTWLAGFEILYAAVQSSLLMAGLLAGVNLALSLAGAYFVLAGSMEAQV